MSVRDSENVRRTLSVVARIVHVHYRHYMSEKFNCYPRSVRFSGGQHVEKLEEKHHVERRIHSYVVYEKLEN